MRFTLGAILLAIAVTAVAAAPVADPAPAAAAKPPNYRQCYYKRDEDGDFIGYKRDVDGLEVRCGVESSE